MAFFFVADLFFLAVFFFVAGFFFLVAFFLTDVFFTAFFFVFFFAFFTADFFASFFAGFFLLFFFLLALFVLDAFFLVPPAALLKARSQLLEYCCVVPDRKMVIAEKSFVLTFLIHSVIYLVLPDRLNKNRSRE